jgi:hypothetical protein
MAAQVRTRSVNVCQERLGFRGIVHGISKDYPVASPYEIMEFDARTGTYVFCSTRSRYEDRATAASRHTIKVGWMYGGQNRAAAMQDTFGQVLERLCLTGEKSKTCWSSGFSLQVLKMLTTLEKSPC